MAWLDAVVSPCGAIQQAWTRDASRLAAFRIDWSLFNYAAKHELQMLRGAVEAVTGSSMPRRAVSMSSRTAGWRCAARSKRIRARRPSWIAWPPLLYIPRWRLPLPAAQPARPPSDRWRLCLRASVRLAPCSGGFWSPPGCWAKAVKENATKMPHAMRAVAGERLQRSVGCGTNAGMGHFTHETAKFWRPDGITSLYHFASAQTRGFGARRRAKLLLVASPSVQASPCSAPLACLP